MSRDDAERAGKREETLLDGLQDLRRRPPPEVRAADGPPEKCVTGKEHVTVVTGHLEAEAAGRVAGRVEDLELVFAARDAVAMHEEPVDDAGGIQREAERLPLFEKVVIQRPIAFMQQDGGARDALEERRAAHVIEVRVGVHEGDRMKPAPGKRLEDAVGLVARVHDHRLLRVGVTHDGAVAAERAHGEGVDDEEAHPGRIIPLDSPKCRFLIFCSKCLASSSRSGCPSSSDCRWPGCWGG